MTSEEAILELKKWQGDSDIEVAHGKADDILCLLLRSLGYPMWWTSTRKWTSGMRSLAMLLLALGCSTPPDTTPARMAALEAQADRVDLAITRVERNSGHRWMVTVVDGQTRCFCSHCGVSYTARREIGGGR